MSTPNASERAKLAVDLNIDPSYLYQLVTGRREMEARAAVALERLSGNRLRRWHLRAKTWHETWPELVGAEGAPPIPGQHDVANGGEAVHAGNVGGAVPVGNLSVAEISE